MSYIQALKRKTKNQQAQTSNQMERQPSPTSSVEILETRGPRAVRYLQELNNQKEIFVPPTRQYQHPIPPLRFPPIGTPFKTPSIINHRSRNQRPTRIAVARDCLFSAQVIRVNPSNLPQPSLPTVPLMPANSIPRDFEEGRNKLIMMGQNHFMVQPYYRKEIPFHNQARFTSLQVEVMEEAEQFPFGKQIRTQFQIVPVEKDSPGNSVQSKSLRDTARGKDPVLDQNPQPHQFPMKILAINARGAGKSDFVRKMKVLLQEYKPLLVIVMDTRMGVNSAVAQIKDFHFDGHYAVAPMGFVGGFWIMWQSEFVKVNVIRGTLRTIHMELEFDENGPGCLLSTVYQFPQLHKQQQETGTAANAQDDPPQDMEGNFCA